MALRERNSRVAPIHAGVSQQGTELAKQASEFLTAMVIVGNCLCSTDNPMGRITRSQHRCPKTMMMPSILTRIR